MLFIVIAVAVVPLLPGSAADTTAPDFTLKDLDGNNVKLTDVLKTHELVLIDFWNIACKPCAEFMNSFDPWNEEYGDRGFTILSINTDSSQTTSKVKPFISGRNYEFTVLLDPNLEVYKRYQVKGVPTTLLVNKNREIVLRHLGYKKGVEEEIEDAIEANLPQAD
jgi:peroxiredoxin